MMAKNCGKTDDNELVINMSLEKSIELDSKVKAEASGNSIKLSGPKGETSRDFSSPSFDKKLKIAVDGSRVVVSSTEDSKKMKTMIGTITAHVKNMQTGVLNGYEYVLRVHYNHFPINVEVKGDKIYIKNFLGEKGARVTSIVKNSKVDVKKDEIVVTSHEKEAAGQTAANIEQTCKVTKRDRRIFQDGIFIVSKPK